MGSSLKWTVLSQSGRSMGVHLGMRRLWIVRIFIDFGTQMNVMSPTLNIDHQHHILAYLVKFVIGLHSMPLLMSKDHLHVYHMVYTCRCGFTCMIIRNLSLSQREKSNRKPLYVNHIVSICKESCHYGTKL